MGLLSQLEKLGSTKNEKAVVRTNSGETRAEDSQEETLSGGPPTPCVTCGSVIAWWDRYGGGPHCHRCRDWPSFAIVARIAAVVSGSTVPAGAEGTTRWLKLWTLDAAGAQCGPQDSPGALEAFCGHRRGRNRAVWPVAERDGILVADLERVAEVEEFWECSGCGEWFSVSEIEIEIADGNLKNGARADSEKRTSDRG